MIQTKDSNLTFRPLTIDDAEQYNALLRYAFQVTEQELSESGWKDDEIKQSKFPVLVRADVLGVFFCARRIWYHSSRFIRWT